MLWTRAKQQKKKKRCQWNTINTVLHLDVTYLQLIILDSYMYVQGTKKLKNLQEACAWKLKEAHDSESYWRRKLNDVLKHNHPSSTKYRTHGCHRHHWLSSWRAEHHWLRHRHRHDVAERLRCHWLGLLRDGLLGLGLFGGRAPEGHAHNVLEVIERWFGLRRRDGRRTSGGGGDRLGEVSHTHKRVCSGSL